ncbi:polymer-forming cytoskeletal protein [Clostridium sp. LP20]|uniref:polymer-forming cytoskeletal protein n=1 Tax=Clostridium sp. LP20 TaxID=3418665 RepID=UPI003EE5B7C9
MEKNNNIKMEGIGQITGGTYNNIKIEGISTILGDIQGERMVVEGVAKVRGAIRCNNLDIEGKFNCKGNVDVSNRFNVSGYASIDGNCQCGELISDGKLMVRGLLSADKIVLEITATNEIKEIGGEEIRVIEGKKSIFQGLFYSNKLVSHLIEGDNIYIENTECSIVRGRNIKINKGCIIDKVEYTGEISIDNRSTVKNLVKL